MQVDQNSAERHGSVSFHSVGERNVDVDAFL
jgi:hypothetical protein